MNTVPKAIPYLLQGKGSRLDLLPCNTSGTERATWESLIKMLDLFPCKGARHRKDHEDRADREHVVPFRGQPVADLTRGHGS